MEQEIRGEETSELGPEYGLEVSIGRGAYATVLEAVHVPSGKNVAIKQQRSVLDEPETAKRILRELFLLRALQDHPFIVKVYDLFVPPKAEEPFSPLCLVMELMQTSMGKLIKSSLKLDLEQVKTIIYNLLLGLHYIHSAGVVHRDIKPANILVSADCSIRICDFGMARILTQQQISQAVTIAEIGSAPRSEESKTPPKPSLSTSMATPSYHRAGSAVAGDCEIKKLGAANRKLTQHVVTRWYRAPEVMLAEGNYGTAVDVWGAGCVLGELLGMLKGPARPKVRTPLFPGKSCYPFSPPNDSQEGGHAESFNGAVTAALPQAAPLSPVLLKEGIGQNDQICVIMEVLGSPTEADRQFITDPKKQLLLKSMPQYQGIDFKEKFPNAPSEALHLLRKMLEFNPKQRPTIASCLNHPFFGTVRRPALEIVAPAPVTMDFETEEEISIADLYRLLERELAAYAQIKARQLPSHA